MHQQQRVGAPRHYTICDEFHISSIPFEFYVGFEENVSFKGVACFFNEPQTRRRGRMQTSFIPGRLLGGDGFQRQLLLWGVIDERWNNTLHRPIHAVGLFLNPAFSYACGFDFDAEIMDGFLSCVQKKVRSPEQRIEISKQIETYKMAGGIFGFEMAVTDRTIKMPGIF